MTPQTRHSLEQELAALMAVPNPAGADDTDRADQVVDAWLARKELYARTVTLKVRYSDFTTITRSHTEAPTRDEESIVVRATALLDKTEAGTRPVRLLGVSVHNLVEELTVADDEQPRLPFEGDETKEDAV